jgi:nucleoside-diphosphate-sugar epimerase
MKKLNKTTYAKAKADVERAISTFACRNFHPVFMRSATVYGFFPCLRLDLVVNNLVACAYLTGKISIMSDGTPWRPIIHIEALCRAFEIVLKAPVEKIHNQPFNVGSDSENYQVKKIARYVEKHIPHVPKGREPRACTGVNEVLLCRYFDIMVQ